MAFKNVFFFDFLNVPDSNEYYCHTKLMTADGNDTEEVGEGGENMLTVEMLDCKCVASLS